MSTILDALKKSEHERKINTTPTLSTMSAPVESSRWPVYVIIVLLVLLLGLIAYWVLASTSSVNSSKSSSSTIKSLVGNGLEATDEDELMSNVVVNVVSYADQIDRRFVMINDALYYEGDFIKPGLKVERINLDEVILNNRGELISKKP